MIIFDCNGVLVDSERIAAAVAAEEFRRVGIPLTPELVARYFTDRGIDASRLKVVAYGEERPACTASREEDCRAKNRRDEFVILSGF